MCSPAYAPTGGSGSRFCCASQDLRGRPASNLISRHRANGNFIRRPKCMSITPHPTPPPPPAEASRWCDGKQNRKQERIHSFKTGKTWVMKKRNDGMTGFTHRHTLKSENYHQTTTTFPWQHAAVCCRPTCERRGGGEQIQGVVMKHPTARMSCEAAGRG